MVNQYGESELIRRSIFSMAGSFGHLVGNATLFHNFGAA